MELNGDFYELFDIESTNEAIEPFFHLNKQDELANDMKSSFVQIIFLKSSTFQTAIQIL